VPSRRRFPKGVSIANASRARGRRRKFPRDIQSPRFLSNLAAPKEKLDTPPTMYMHNWNNAGVQIPLMGAPNQINYNSLLGSNGSLDVPGHNAIAEKVDGAWRYVSSPNFNAVNNNATYILGGMSFPESMARFGDTIFLGGAGGGVVSIDGGETWSKDYPLRALDNVGNKVYYAFDAEGRAWRYDDSYNGFTTVFRSESGFGAGRSEGERDHFLISSFESTSHPETNQEHDQEINDQRDGDAHHV